jgi:hypothetical protein
MKRAVLFFSILFIVASIQAQDIFKQHGYNKEMLTLSKGKYKEVFTNDEVVQIGTVLLNTKDGKVIKFLEDGNPELSYKEEYSSRFLTMDPLAEKFPWQSPYVFCSNNPVNRIDPTGMADFWHNGSVIGNDGVDDQRVLVLQATQKRFESETDNVAGAGLSKSDLKATVKFIKQNTGNTEAFLNNGMAYTNSIAIESSADNRQAMVNEVSRDNGRGGTADANNREYGGSIQNGAVVLATQGAVSNPSVQNNASIMLPDVSTTFHSHPSGTRSETVTGGTKNSWFNQFPSSVDVNNAGGGTHYVFGRGNNTVYIYNSNGVQAVVPMRYFVNPKR